MYFSIGGADSSCQPILICLPSVIKGRPKWIGVILALIYTAVYFSWIQTISYNYYVSLKKTFIAPDFIDERNVTILLWTKLFSLDDVVHDGTETFYFDANHNVEGLFERCSPPMNRCRVTNNRSLIEQSEAIIIHAQDMTGINWPEFRSPHQRWIFFNVETPLRTNSKEILKNLPHHLHFNWTFTYRRDSDVVIPYGPSTAHEYQRRLAMEVKTGGIDSSSLSAIIKNKTKLVAWVVSNCDAGNGRDDYVNELSKYITVDVYGGCSPLKCDNRSSDFDNFNPPLGCYELRERDYKFYLAFENSICPDYVTEKFFNTLLFSTVPIVYGGADYVANGAPTNSYIDVRNFTSARHLADYLRYLDKNETAYRNYFDWRLKPSALASLRPVQPWCNLCHKLLTENRVNGGVVTTNNKSSQSFSVSALTNKSYDNIYSWWFVTQPCQPPIKPF